MAMTTDPFAAPDEEQDMMSNINTTPLVDVMLVLLIIFLITIPVITKTVPLTLPKAVNIPTQTKPENVTVAINAKGDIFWNERRVPNNTALLEQIKQTAVKKPQPELHIRADRNVRYESVGKVIYLIQRGGIIKVGFIIQPDRGGQAAPAQ
jgi:biopolymer transport protein ExbD